MFADQNPIPAAPLYRLVTEFFEVLTTSAQVHKSAGIPLEAKNWVQNTTQHNLHVLLTDLQHSVMLPTLLTLFLLPTRCLRLPICINHHGININNKGNTEITDRSPASKYLATSSLNRFLDRFHDLFTAHGIRLIAFTYFLSFAETLGGLVTASDSLLGCSNPRDCCAYNLLNSF